MNLFYLSDDPKICALWAVDRHVVKMTLEAAQLLSTAHRVIDGKETTFSSTSGRKKKHWCLPDDEREMELYNATHINHPCAIWVRENINNYRWTWDYLYQHCREYTYRYDKVHKIERDGLLSLLHLPPRGIKYGPKTPVPCAMDTKYIVSTDPIVNYRNYYKYGKEHLHKWKRREAPDWIC